jgi:cobalt-zinc-cadmium resistance protein CzcA
MDKFINLLVERRWLVATLFVIVSVFGVYAWTRLSVDAYPDIADVTVQVVTQVPGLAAEEIEQQITIPLERELNGIPNLHVMRSKNTFGLSIIMLVFNDREDDYWARQRVTERIGKVELPYGASPELNPLTSPTGEIYRYIIESKTHSLRELTDLNKWVVIPRLRQISGIADVSNFGGITTQFQIEIDPARLERYGISLSDVTGTIERNNTNAGGSMIDRGDLSYVVRGIGLVKDLEDMGKIVVKTVNGVPVYLNDVGTLKYGNLERKGILGFTDAAGRDYSDGVEGIVQMLRFQNPSQVLEEVHAAVDELNRKTLPEGVRIHPFMDRTELVNATLHTVSHTLLFGMILVVAVLIIFLGSWRGALLVAVTIPLSLLIAFILMLVTDIPANLLSLGAIDFGILVDGSIVMLETILKKREDDAGAPLEQPSIVRRIREISRPVFFATLIIIVAYVPLFAFERIEKKLFTPMAFTVGYALLGALAAALLLIPCMAYVIYRKPQKIYHNRWLEKLIRMYRQQTARIVQRPKRVFLPAALVLAMAAVLSITVGKDFLPPLDEGGIWIQTQMPPGLSLDKATEMSETLRNRLAGFDEVTYVMSQTGRDDEGAEAFSTSHVEYSIGLKPYGQWKNGRRKTDLINDMADVIAGMPGYTAGFSQPIIDMVMDQVAGSHSDLAVKIYGEDPVETRRIAEDVETVVRSIKGSADVVIDQEPPLPQLQIAIDRDRIARYGLNAADVSELIEVAVGGKAVSRVFIGSKVYDVICRYNARYRDTPEKIGGLMLTSGSRAKIPLSQVAEVKTATGASTVTREMNRRHLTVRINLRGRDLTSFLEEASERIRERVRYDPASCQIRWDGQFENRNRAYSRLAVVVPLVLALMFLLLYGAFGDFRQAGLLIGLLPMAIFGGMLALTVRGMSFNVSSAVGFIALFGVSIQNGVIMISHINILRKRGTELKDAVIAGSSHRLRPVLMTATVAILGLLPASLSTGIGSDVQRPLATVIVYGLLFGTVITLYVLPALYYMLEKSKLKPVLTVLLLLCAVSAVEAQEKRVLTFDEYLNRVKCNNIAYLAEKYNVDLADAGLKAAGVFPDPELSVSYANNQNWNLRMGYGVDAELSYTLELGGKRKARISAARSEKEVTEALLEDYFRNLRADAAIVWLAVLKQKKMCEIQQSSYRRMLELARADSIRYRLGSIAEVDARQSRLEAASMLNDVYSDEGALRDVLAQLLLFEGDKRLEMPDSIAGELSYSKREFDLQELIAAAQNNRADLQAATKAKEMSQHNLRLAKANRAIDLGLSIGGSYSAKVLNTIAPAPAYTGVTAGVSIPLKLSNRNRGELHAARMAAGQQELAYEAIELQIRSEVMQAHNRYVVSCRQAEQFGAGGLLDDAGAILNRKIYSYERGETGILEVLNAQRTYNDVQINYSETLYNCAAALVELERACGTLLK